MKRFEYIKKMSVEEMAKFFSTDSFPDLPHSPCNICQYKEVMWCSKPDGCTDEYQIKVYEKWLNEEFSN